MKTTIHISRSLKCLTTGIEALLLAAASAGIVCAASPTNTKNGVGAGKSLTTGTHNTAFGYSALRADKTGSFNTAVGDSALSNTTASNNVAVGFQALFKNKQGGFNVAVGDGALRNNLGGSENIAIGEDAGFNLTGSRNIAIGSQGVAGESGTIRIGTKGTHTDTFIAGVLHGNGLGLTGVPVATKAVGSTQLANNAVLREKIVDGAVDNTKLAVNAVEAVNIADGTISLADLSTALKKYFTPPGTVVAFAGTTAPAGWLLCDGAQVSRTLFPDLFTVIGIAHGLGNGTTTFHLPDYRGRLLRGVDGTAARDPDNGKRTAMAASGNVGNKVGSVQSSILPTHLHRWGYSNTGDQYTRSLFSWDGNGTAQTVLQDYEQMQIEDGVNEQADNFKEVSPAANNQSFYTDRNTGSTIASGQVAPANAYVNYLIKY